MVAEGCWGVGNAKRVSIEREFNNVFICSFPCRGRERRMAVVRIACGCRKTTRVPEKEILQFLVPVFAVKIFKGWDEGGGGEAGGY